MTYLDIVQENVYFLILHMEFVFILRTALRKER